MLPGWPSALHRCAYRNDMALRQGKNQIGFFVDDKYTGDASVSGAVRICRLHVKQQSVMFCKPVWSQAGSLHYHPGFLEGFNKSRFG